MFSFMKTKQTKEHYKCEPRNPLLSFFRFRSFAFLFLFAGIFFRRLRWWCTDITDRQRNFNGGIIQIGKRSQYVVNGLGFSVRQCAKRMFNNEVILQAISLKKAHVVLLTVEVVSSIVRLTPKSESKRQSVLGS